MAVRYPASGGHNVTLTLGSQTNYTFACWAQIVTDRNTFSTVWSFDANMDGSAFILQTDSDGTTMKVYDDGVGNFVATGPNMTVGTWYYLCVAVAGTSGTFYWRAANTQTMSSATWTSAARTITRVLIGDDRYSEPLNGRVAAHTFWQAGLTAAEVANESQRQVPIRLANLRTFYPFVRTETTDYSGNGHTLSGGAGTSTEDGPPVAWYPVAPRLILPAAAAGGVAELGTATVGLAAIGTAVKVAKVSGVCSMGMTATGVAAKRAPAAGPAAVGLAATGRATKKAPEVGVAVLGLAATRAEVVSRAQSGTAALGLAPRGVAAKRAPTAGVSTVGLSATRSGLTVRAVSGVCCFGVAASSTPRKTAVGSGVSGLGAAATCLPRKRAAIAGSASLGAHARGTAAKRGTTVGRACLGLVSTGVPAKTAAARGVAGLGLCSTYLSVVLPVTVLSSAGQVRKVWDTDDPPDVTWRSGRIVQPVWRVP